MVSGNSMSIIGCRETIFDLENGMGQPFDTGWFSPTVEFSNNGSPELYVHSQMVHDNLSMLGSFHQPQILTQWFWRTLWMLYGFSTPSTLS